MARLAERSEADSTFMFYIYVLRSVNFKKSYVGHTDNIERRLKEHNSGKNIFTNKYKPWNIIHKEEFIGLSQAIMREKFFKSKSGRKYLKTKIFNN